MAKQDPEAGNEPILAALAFKSLADSSCSLHLLQRYEVSLDRQYSRALNNLLKSRAAARMKKRSKVPPRRTTRRQRPNPNRNFQRNPICLLNQRPAAGKIKLVQPRNQLP
jgi:hypothetical protein